MHAAAAMQPQAGQQRSLAIQPAVRPPDPACQLVQRRPRRGRQQQQTTCAALLPAASLLLALGDAAASAGAPAAAAVVGATFEPLGPSPAIAVAAACAAAPPLIFWARIFRANQKRLQAIADAKSEEERKQAAREVLKRKITGQDGAADS